MKRLIISERLSQKQAEGLVADLVRFGDWTSGEFAPTDAVQSILWQRGARLSDLARKCRQFSESVVWFENLIGPGWTVSGKGLSIVRFAADGSPINVSGPIEDGAEVSLCSYLSKFVAATGHLRQIAITQRSSEMLAAVSTGVASVDSFVITLATHWNSHHPDTPFNLAEHSSLSDRIDVWIPRITSKKFDKGRASWAAHTRLREIRNELDQHDKSGFKVTTPRDLVRVGNDFAPGIAEVMFDLHVIAGMRVPSKIVRFKYFPGFYLA
jgi:hypothetical protein